ncbi:hypothetical protein H4R18_003248 [Coemansia javaensis]|uniref:Mitochondrial cardiolipin hydrolase n=1 Tax=Coemansia javaensis TaxID=2761396 RepID=A0A9W8H9C4_9FUNG|nr:hypothetical protein H4R18_003248 [Coemansia javaensis]
MSLVDILSACFGSGGGGGSARTAPYLGVQAAAQMPLDEFVQRSLESAPSALEQEGEFSEILARHMQDGASAAHLAQVVQNSLARLASNDTDRATARWACRMLALAAQQQTQPHTQPGGYVPPKGPGMSYAAVAGSGGGNSEKQQQHHHPRGQQDSGVYIHSYFFPSEDSFSKLIQFLNSARTSLDICVFNITDNDVARAISNAKGRGVTVRIITDDEQLSCKGSDIERLQQDYGIPFKTDNDPAKFMHSKFAVVDRRAVWAGSYNWTVAARRSNNESVICTNDPGTAAAFGAEFDRLWAQF